MQAAVKLLHISVADRVCYFFCRFPACQFFCDTESEIHSRAKSLSGNNVIVNCNAFVCNIHFSSSADCFFKIRMAAQIAVDTVMEYKKTTGSDIKVIFNVFKDDDLMIYRNLLNC